MTETDRTIGRLRLKIEKRDRRIEGLMRRISNLEAALATRTIMAERLPSDIAKAVQTALCNVRMIPVLGIRSNDRIIEVRSAAQADDERGAG